jgi:hypothetical protein
MTFKTSLFALTLGCIPLFASGCGGTTGADSETDSVTSELELEVRTPFSGGSASGMTSGGGALVDAPLDGFLGWRGPEVPILGVMVQQPAFVFEHGFAPPDTAMATLTWKKYVAQESGNHQVQATRDYKVAGTLTVSGIGPASSGRVELVVQTLLEGNVIAEDSCDVITLSASTGQRSASFNELVPMRNIFNVFAYAGQSIGYRSRLILHADTNSSGKAKFLVKWFGMHTNATPNTNQTVTIERP